MNKGEPPPQELLGFFEAERAVPRVDASVRVALRDRLAASFAQEAPLDEPRQTRGELARATAQEPVAAPPGSGRTKGKMNFFDKRIIGTATLIATAIGLIGVTIYKRRVEAPTPQRQDHGPTVDLVGSSAMTPRFSPVEPTTGADLAITAGESAWIHAPFGAVDIEIQSQCNADVELSSASEGLWVRNSERGDATALSTKPSGSIIAGTDSADGRARRYHLTPGIDFHHGVYTYTSRCMGQPPMRGNIIVDRIDISEPLGDSAQPQTSNWFRNARVYSAVVEHGIKVFGTVLPGARVSIGTTPLVLGPADATGSDPATYPTFTIKSEVSVPPEHLLVAVRVDDANGTHFYVLQPSGACTTTMTAPKQTAALLDAQGFHAGALAAFETVMAACKPDRQTLSLAFEYACKAGDREAARKYWRKLPAELQRMLEPLCARNDITWEALDRP